VQVFLFEQHGNLNWTFTELEVIMRELAKTAVGYQTTEAQRLLNEAQRLLQRCGSFFELVVKLLRIVELLALEIPAIFLSDEMNRRRLVELLLYVISRTTTGNDSNMFESILALGAAHYGLDQIARVTVLAPIVGTLMNLDEERENAGRIVEEIVSMDLCKVELFDYLKEFDWMKAVPDDENLEMRLMKCELFVDKVKKRVKEKLEEEEQKKGKEKGGLESGEGGSTSGDTKNPVMAEEEEELCSICYADPINTTFNPCKHRSCKRCIQRHMLGSDSCFFCKAKIQSLEYN